MFHLVFITTRFFHYFSLAFLLVACAGEDSRYRDTSMLEKPPTLAIIKSPAAEYEPDESSIPKKQDPGLKEQVYLTETEPVQLKIKQPLEKAWSFVLQAIKLNEIRITDFERNKGHIYVAYDSSGFLEKVTSFLTEGRKPPTYLITLQVSEIETTVSASMANSNEQTTNVSNPDGFYDQPVDDSEELLQTLYKSIHDDIIDE